MKVGTILIEILAIIVIALVLGTGVHLLRPDKPNRIEFVKKYKDPFTVRPRVEPNSESQKNEVVDRKKKPIQVTSVSNPPPDPKDRHDPNGEGPNGQGSNQTDQKDQKDQNLDNGLPPEGPVRMILIDEAIGLHEDEFPFLDARRTKFYKEGHIPRAKSVSVWEAGLEERIVALFNEIPFEMPVVVYCMSANCEDSHMLADALKNAGYMDIRLLKGGFPEWQKKKLKVETGSGEENQ